jgi:hypothetical protein
MSNNNGLSQSSLLQADPSWGRSAMSKVEVATSAYQDDEVDSFPLGEDAHWRISRLAGSDPRAGDQMLFTNFCLERWDGALKMVKDVVDGNPYMSKMMDDLDDALELLQG